VGFQFAQAGKVHYGWARLRVTIQHRQHYEPHTTVAILGYGYETAPNTAIAAGSCGASADSEDRLSPENKTAASSQVGPTLGMLAGGSPAATLWRRKRIAAGVD
jgi:hypothetical protein